VHSRCHDWLFYLFEHNDEHHTTTTHNDTVGRRQNGTVGACSRQRRKCRGRNSRAICWPRSRPLLHTYVTRYSTCTSWNTNGAKEYFSYNVEALLTLFWAGALAQSIYGFADISAFKRVRRKANGICKVFAVVMPATLISLLQLPSVRSSFTGFLVVANINSQYTIGFAYKKTRSLASKLTTAQ
jgi:hypothetical protein